ncbi:hypothetical protein BD289DRAFT_479494 [Coniella lustricola]|uniref:Uncharacterized protein n=1 Tax=Coniella lustricola TaxID=2025994 RepID=A0A2T3AIN4_9PEZI|nr:hypothetical protein BD289DRAFT_479494 [Coniella lustricola]
MAASQQSHLDAAGLMHDSPSSTSSASDAASRDAASAAASLARRHDESWVEIASQPSSSSLSSIGDDIVTTGLRVGNRAHPPRRRRLQDHYHQSLQQQQHQQQQQQQRQLMPQSYIVNHAAAHSATSSQDEYDETESEEDGVITSSTENVAPTRPGHDAAGYLQRSQTALGPGAPLLLSDSDDDDDDGTALGRPSPTQSFRPRPNAFSHPPAHLNQRSYSTNAAIPPPTTTHNHPYDRPSWPTHRSHNRPRPDFRNPSYQADRDEALRASLTTLLSCAAAAKSLPGRRANIATSPCAGEPMIGTGLGSSTQPMELRLVQESELGHEASPLLCPGGLKQHNPHQPISRQPTVRTSSNSSAQSQPASISSREEKGKRPAATGQARMQRAAKKKRTSVSPVDDNTVTWISPATLTWVLGTGVVLLVSVVGFGAGFVVGREIGRQDILSSTSGTGSLSAGMNSSSCSSEVIRSTGTGTLKRWRWGTGMARSVVA